MDNSAAGYAWLSILQREQNRQPAAQSNREHQNDAISFRCCACSMLQRHRQCTEELEDKTCNIGRVRIYYAFRPGRLSNTAICLSVCLSVPLGHVPSVSGHGYYRTLIENSMPEVEPTGVTWPLMMGTYRFAVIVSIEHRLTRVTGYNALT